MPKRKEKVLDVQPLPPGRTYSLREVQDMIQLRVEELGTQRAFARELGVSRAFVCDLCQGFRLPSERVLDYLGLEKCYRPVIYQKKEHPNAQ